MITRKRKAILMKAVSELKRADYTSEPELGVMYDRLADGRKQFAEVFDKNINAVMQISSLDLTMQHQTKKNCRYLEKKLHTPQIPYSAQPLAVPTILRRS